MSNSRILIVDDDEAILEMTSRFLEAEGYAVKTAASGADAMGCIKEGVFDALVLDIMLGDCSGFDLVKKIRMSDQIVPVIFLSARGQDSDKIIGLGYGADDYMTKPFSPSELVARLKALMRRTAAIAQASESMTLVSGELLIDLRRYEVSKRGQKIELSSKELKLLTFFMENPNQVFTKKQIYRQVWEQDFHDDNSVMVYINHLREKIEDDPKAPSYIQTVWGIGYKFVPKDSDRGVL